MSAWYRETCGGCGSAALADFLDLGATPLADRFPAPGEPDGESYPLQVAACGSCGLAQLRHVVDDGELYGADYAFMTGASPALAAYYAEWAKWALAEYGPQARQGVAEIACNDGTLLRHFAGAGCPALGIEPAGPPAAAAMEAGLQVIAEPFTEALAKELAALGTPRPGLVIACNVVAHVADPGAFLRGIATVLAPDGVAVIEFQYLGDLIAGAMVDHVYHEHRFFYTLGSLARLAASAGLRVTRFLRTPSQGGSLRVVLARDPQPVGDAGGLVALEGRLRSPELYDGLQARADYARDTLRAFLDAERNLGSVIAGYGAPAKSCTLLHWLGLGPADVAWLEDLTPGKIGRESPGTRIPVRAPSGLRADSYLVLAWNYLPSIVRRERDFLAAGGRLIVPGPVPLVI